MADIVIRGMEIPKEPTNITIYPDGCWCDYTSNDSHGKFVVLPEGHGKLGDLDKIISFIDYYERPMDRSENPFKALNAVRDYICNASNTIIPAEGGKTNEHV